MDEDDEEIFTMVAGVAAVEGTDPTTVKKASARNDWPKWEGAINKKLNSLDEARTWSIVERQENFNVVGASGYSG